MSKAFGKLGKGSGMLKDQRRKSQYEWDMWYKMHAPSITDYYMSASQDPISAKQYQQYWENFANAWSPGGNAPQVPVVGSGRQAMQADAALGSPFVPDFSKEQEELYGMISQLYPWMSAADRWELTRSGGKRSEKDPFWTRAAQRRQR